ncbi:hypothetical protein G5B30_01950 [Sphingobacterium sp. SGG-5]|uniref:hypothetical protein n=1 Tax=Sphingobacterium sp. SGG-5 TaxID=2710881 RepID=UPI0013ECEFED|nr:hypothetical protein [Sphingobacterium sp. SGG-5]NGM60670.1 hypothetical protein [Sphingobacterium sp. SGG-5]
MKKIFYLGALFGAVWTVGSILSCDKDKQLPPEDKVERVLPPIQDEDGGSEGENPDEPKDYVYAIAIMPAEDVDMGGSGVNLATGEVYRGTHAHNYPHAVDLLYLDYGNATKGNIALPESKELSVNVFGEDIQYGWRYKNLGVLYRLSDVQPRDVEWFNGAKSAARIRAVVDSMIAVLSVNPDDQKMRYRDVKGDEIFIFKSTTRNISSIIYVNQQIATSTGSQCRLVIKSDATQLQEVAPVTGGLLNANGNHDEDVINATFSTAANGELFFDFMKKEVYTRAELEDLEDLSGIHLMFAYKSSTNSHYIYTPTSSWMYGGSGNSSSHYTPGDRTLYNYLNASGTNISTMYFWRIDNFTSPLYTNNTFEQVRLNNPALYTYYYYWNTGSWGSNGINPGVGLTYRIRNVTHGGSGAFKILNVNKTIGEISVGVKYWNSLD